MEVIRIFLFSFIENDEIEKVCMIRKIKLINIELQNIELFKNNLGKAGSLVFTPFNSITRTEFSIVVEFINLQNFKKRN